MNVCVCVQSKFEAHAAKVAKNFNLKLSILTNYFFRCYEPNILSPYTYTCIQCVHCAHKHSILYLCIMCTLFLTFEASRTLLSTISSCCFFPSHFCSLATCTIPIRHSSSRSLFLPNSICVFRSVAILWTLYSILCLLLRYKILWKFRLLLFFCIDDGDNNNNNIDEDDEKRVF